MTKEYKFVHRDVFFYVTLVDATKVHKNPPKNTFGYSISFKMKVGGLYTRKGLITEELMSEEWQKALADVLFDRYPTEKHLNDQPLTFK